MKTRAPKDFMVIKKRKKLYWLIFGLIFSGFFYAGNALAFKLGENQLFFVDPSYDLSERTQINGTLRQVGDHALFYTADDWWSSLGTAEVESANTAILSLAAEFDRTIYPRLTQVYGSEWSPGIDNDLRVTILITRIKKGTGGYFNSSDEYPRSQVVNSNEREMIYLNSLYLISSSARDFLAHEFQHMINFYQKEKLRNSTEEVWLNEARSEYAATLCGFDSPYEGSNLERRVKDFLRYSTDSLTEWRNESADYGAANLFMQYLVNRYGEQILTRMMKTEKVGVESINQALADTGFSERFIDIFTNWTIANFVNDCQLGEGQKYCYLNQKLNYGSFHLQPQISNFLSVRDGAEFSFADEVKDWSGRWYEILPIGSGLNLMIDFKNQVGSTFQAALLILDFNGAKTLRPLKFNSAQAAADIVADFGSRVASVVLILSNQTKQKGFTSNETAREFSYVAKITASSQLPAVTPASSSQPTPTPSPEPAPVVSPNFPDGSLVRAKGESKVYIIQGQYRRWLQTPQILAAYPHLGWQSIREVTLEQLNWYQEVWLVRAEGDARVFEINGDSTKHWLNMSADSFSLSGRSWKMVYIVNKTERDLYRTGAEVLR